MLLQRLYDVVRRHSEHCQLELEKKEIPGLIKMFQTVRNERTLKFISSSWQRFECLGAAQSVCHWRVAFVRQQIVQTRPFTQDAAPEEPLSELSTPFLERVQTSQHQRHLIITSHDNIKPVVYNTPIIIMMIMIINGNDQRTQTSSESSAII